MINQRYQSSLIRNIKNYHKTQERLEKELGRKGIPEEIACEMGIPVEEINLIANLKIEEEEDNNKLRIKITIKNHTLEKARAIKGYTQEKLAKLLKISTASYSKIENCKTLWLAIQPKIAKILKVPEDILFSKQIEKFTREWRYKEQTSFIVPLEQISIETPEVLLLEDNNFQRLVETTDAKLTTDKILKELNPKELTVIEMHYGLKNGIPLTLEQTGEEFGVTRERVRQIEAKAFEKIKNKYPKLNNKN